MHSLGCYEGILEKFASLLQRKVALRCPDANRGKLAVIVIAAVTMHTK